MSGVIGLVLLVIVTVGFAVLAMQIRARRVRARPIESLVRDDQELFRSPVEIRVFYRDRQGSKAVTTFGGLASLELVVGRESWHLASKPKGLLGNDWYFRARDTSMESVQSLVRDPSGREWIVLTGPRDRGKARVAVSAGTLLDVWASLLQAGVKATSVAPNS